MGVDKRVLIVDDEEKVVFFLRESLEELGHDFSIGTANSGEEALNKIEGHPYDLVISDLRMPGLDGLQLLERVKEKYPNTRFILMTAYGSDEVEARAHDLEVYDYITKPFHVSDLLAVARHALADLVAPEDSGLAPSEDQMDAINRALSNLRFEVGAQCIVLADMEGQIVSEMGITHGLDTGTFAPLMADAVTSVSGMAQYLQDEETFNLNFYEGRKYDIYSTSVGDALFLTLIFDRKKQPSRIGMVWLYVKRTIQDLLSTLSGRSDVADSELELLEEIPPPEPVMESREIDLEEEVIVSATTDPEEPPHETEIQDEPEGDISTFGIEEALRKGLIDEDFAQLLKGED
jgi:CheY-like chemotaxis protein/predicted regulator of Ras-like GTPase activity (Roadblock/LC7/MglB family)